MSVVDAVMEWELIVGTQELNKAYPRLKRDWSACGGYILRLTNPNLKGVPDFLISHPTTGSGLAEVKCVDDPRDIIGLEHHQAKTLDEASQGGAKGRVLVYCLKEEKWGLFFGGTLQQHYKVLRFQMAPRFSEKVTPEWALGEKRWVKSLSISHDNEMETNI